VSPALAPRNIRWHACTAEHPPTLWPRIRPTLGRTTSIHMLSRQGRVEHWQPRLSRYPLSACLNIRCSCSHDQPGSAWLSVGAQTTCTRTCAHVHAACAHATPIMAFDASCPWWHAHGSNGTHTHAQHSTQTTHDALTTRTRPLRSSTAWPRSLHSNLVPSSELIQRRLGGR